MCYLLCRTWQNAPWRSRIASKWLWWSPQIYSFSKDIVQPLMEKDPYMTLVLISNCCRNGSNSAVPHNHFEHSANPIQLHPRLITAFAFSTIFQSTVVQYKRQMSIFRTFNSFIKNTIIKILHDVPEVIIFYHLVIFLRWLVS